MSERWIMQGGYELRPEALEAMFFLYRGTHDEKYRDQAWSIFEAIERHSRVRRRDAAKTDRCGEGSRESGETCSRWGGPLEGTLDGIEVEVATEWGYATLKSARARAPKQADTMHSFFIAETLKYLYLIFSDDDVLPLDKYVFNTEAHPFLIWDAEDEKGGG